MKINSCIQTSFKLRGKHTKIIRNQKEQMETEQRIMRQKTDYALESDL